MRCNKVGRSCCLRGEARSQAVRLSLTLMISYHTSPPPFTLRISSSSCFSRIENLAPHPSSRLGLWNQTQKDGYNATPHLTLVRCCRSRQDSLFCRLKSLCSERASPNYRCAAIPFTSSSFTHLPTCAPYIRRRARTNIHLPSRVPHHITSAGRTT